MEMRKLFKVAVADDGIMQVILKTGTNKEQVKIDVLKDPMFTNITNIHVKEVYEIDGYEISVGKHKDERTKDSELIKTFQNDNDIYSLYHVTKDVYRVYAVYTERVTVLRIDSHKNAIKKVSKMVKNYEL